MGRRAWGRKSTAETDRVVLTRDLEVRVQLALQGAAWRLMTRRPCCLLWAQLLGLLLARLVQRDLCSPNCSCLCFLPSPDFGIPSSAWALWEAISGQLLTSRRRRECWSPWSVVLFSLLPGSQAPGEVVGSSIFGLPRTLE